MSECVYEVRDVTDDETYFSLGVYSELQSAINFCAEGDDPPHADYTEPDLDHVVMLKVMERPLNLWLEHCKAVANVCWEASHDARKGEVTWDCKVEVLAKARGESLADGD